MSAYRKNWTVAVSSCVVSACLEDWSTEVYVVFAKGLKCQEKKIKALHPLRTMAKQVYFPHILITFLLPLLGGGLQERLNLIKGRLQNTFMPTTTYLHLLRQGLSLPGTCQVGWPGWPVSPQDQPVFTFLGLERQVCTTILGFFTWF